MSWAAHYAGVYRKPQREYTQITACPWAGLHISGLKLWELPAHGVSLKNPGPFLLLLPQGTKIHFQAAAPRENWVVFLGPGSVEPASRPGFAKASFEGVSAELPVYLELDEAAASALQLEFIRVKEGCESPLPQDRMLGALSMANILRTALEKASGAEGRSPAQELKSLIDKSPGDWTPLAELAGNCGFSADHLRKLFLAEFGMNPNEYRERRRMAAARELLARSRLSVKEVSERLGFSYLSHFSASFKASAGMTPSECVRRFRQRGPEAP